MQRMREVNRIVHDVTARFGGSISAEHGLGVYKREEILRYKSPLEMELMRTVKRAQSPSVRRGAFVNSLTLPPS